MTLRQLMTDEIKAYGWLDIYFDREDQNAKEFDDYEKWLNSLSDSDFLFRYKHMQDANSIKGNT